MNKSALDLSKLTEFLTSTLNSTEEVKNILKTQCEEVKYVLAPWQLETITRREIDKNSCTCVKVLSSEDHVKEIASGIDRAVLQARNLREKLATNVLEEKKIARRPSVQQIYAASGGARKIASRSNLLEPSKAGERGKENGKLEAIGDKKNSKVELNSKGKKAEKVGERNSCGTNNNSKEKLQKQDHTLVKNNSKASSNINKKILEPKRSINDKKLTGTSPYNTLVAASKEDHKSKRKKNFIAANKSSIKNIQSSLKHATGSSASKNESSSRNLIHGSEHSAARKSSELLISRAESATEFENLISKICLETQNRNTENLIKENGCPIHDKNAEKFIEEKIYTSIDVAEGLDRFGVPSELVKILKIYHGYLNNVQSDSKPDNKRGEKAASKFLQEFDSMNRARRKGSIKQKLDNICVNFLPLFKDCFDKRIDFIELSKLKVRYTDLDSAFKLLGIKNISPTKRKVSNMVENRCARINFQISRNWRLNSVWNEACISNLEGMSLTRCIRYANKNQLLELFESIQRLQQIKYQNNLVDLLVKDVVPVVRDSLEPTSEEYIAIFKMISIISNTLCLKVPVLVRTDE